MKKRFNFGYIDYENRGTARNLVTVDIEYTEKKEGQKVFTASGSVWNCRHTDIIAGGQCLDTIAEYITAPEFLEILDLWKKYHLNDMHAECEHQAAAGWREKAAERVTLYHWRMTREALNEQKAAENAALSALKAGETFTPMVQQTFISCLSYSLTTHTDTPPADIAHYYEPKKPLYSGDKGHTETKLLGHLHEEEHPAGILARACPVCGYKYGTSWLYVPIPSEDEKRIYKLLGEVTQ